MSRIRSYSYLHYTNS